MNILKSMASIIIAWLILFFILIIYGVLNPQKDALTLLFTGYALMPFVAFAVFSINCLIHKKSLKSKWVYIIIYLILVIWMIIWFCEFFMDNR